MVVLFASCWTCSATPARIRRLLAVVATVGLVVAAIAAYQNLTGATTIYGLVPAAHRNAGPFMNYSHFSQFMNLSVGAALALLLDRVAELGEFYRTPAEVWAALRQPRQAAVWAWAVLCVAGPLVVLLSLSRMGMISLGVATVVTGGMLVWRGRAGRGAGGGGSSVGLGLAVFVVLLGVGLDVVANRLGSLRDLRASGGGRQEMLRDMRAEFRQFPVLGTGLGTHEFVFPEFDRRDLASLADHADERVRPAAGGDRGGRRRPGRGVPGRAGRQLRPGHPPAGRGDRLRAVRAGLRPGGDPGPQRRPTSASTSRPTRP